MKSQRLTQCIIGLLLLVGLSMPTYAGEEYYFRITNVGYDEVRITLSNMLRIKQNAICSGNMSCQLAPLISTGWKQVLTDSSDRRQDYSEFVFNSTGSDQTWDAADIFSEGLLSLHNRYGQRPDALELLSFKEGALDYRSELYDCGFNHPNKPGRRHYDIFIVSKRPPMSFVRSAVACPCDEEVDDAPGLCKRTCERRDTRGQCIS